jgi:GT2 family glycosyltransferase
MSVDVSVVLVNFNTGHLLDECFDSLFQSLGSMRNQVILVDNASEDDSLSRIKGLKEALTVVSNDQNVGFGRANNQAVPFATGRHLLLLNTDAFVAPDTLTKTVAWMDAHPDCGVLGVRLTDREGNLQPSCRYFPTPLNTFLVRTGLQRLFPWVKSVDDMAWDHSTVRECDWVPGCYYLIRREVLDQVGLFDPRFFLYCEEVDHCRRVKAAGWKVMFYPDTSVVHIGGESAKAVGQITASGRQISALQLESELLYIRKHYGRAGLMTQIILLGAGDLILATKQFIKRLLGISSTGNFQPLLASSWRLLVASDWGRRPLH